MKLIVTADWHLKATMPRCRKDKNWIETQKKILNQIVLISKNKNAPVFVVGDIFDSNSDTSFEVISLVQEMANELGELYILAGNHDLPYHSSENINKSAVGILLKSDFVHPISHIMKFEKSSWKYSISASNFDKEDDYNAEIIFKHILTLPEKNPMFESETPETLIKKFPNSKWIFTGDYHKAFNVEIKGCHVINPGCLIREKSDFKDYQCGVYYVDTEDEIVEFIPIIDNEELMDDSYITFQNEKEERIDNFISALKKSKTFTLNFTENVEIGINENKFEEELKNMIYDLMEI